MLYFFGERIDKIGPDKYRLVNGRLTTCVQATPRWELEARRRYWSKTGMP